MRGETSPHSGTQKKGRNFRPFFISAMAATKRSRPSVPAVGPAGTRGSYLATRVPVGPVCITA